MLVYPASRNDTLCYLNMAREEESRCPKGLCVAAPKTVIKSNKGPQRRGRDVEFVCKRGSGRKMNSVGGSTRGGSFEGRWS